MKQKLLNRIVINSNIITEKPVIKGTWIPVVIILKKLAQNIDTNEIFNDFPRLKKDNIKTAIMYAESLVENDEVFPLIPSLV